MKGLIIKDFYAIKNGIRLSVFISIGIFLFMLLCKLSSDYGNLKGSFDMDSLSYIVVLLGVTITIIFSTFVVEVMDKDNKSGIIKTIRSAPISYKKIVSSRYIMLGLLSALGYATSIIFFVLCHFTGIKDFSLKAIGIVLLVQIACISISSICICVTQITGSVDIGMFSVYGFLIVILSLMVLYIKTKSEYKGMALEVVLLNAIMKNKLITVITIGVLSAVLTIISYILSTRIVRDDI